MAKTPWPLEVARPQKEMSCQLSDIWSCEGQEICNGSCLLFTLAFFGDRFFFVWYDVDLHVILDDLTLDLQIRQEICFTQISFHSLCDLVSKPP